MYVCMYECIYIYMYIYIQRRPKLDFQDQGLSISRITASVQGKDTYLDPGRFTFAPNGLPRAWIWTRLRVVRTARHGAFICGHPSARGGNKSSPPPNKKRRPQCRRKRATWRARRCRRWSSRRRPRCGRRTAPLASCGGGRSSRRVSPVLFVSFFPQKYVCAVLLCL